jgi:hypothetical protein
MSHWLVPDYYNKHDDGDDAEKEREESKGRSCAKNPLYIVIHPLPSRCRGDADEPNTGFYIGMYRPDSTTVMNNEIAPATPTMAGPPPPLPIDPSSSTSELPILGPVQSGPSSPSPPSYVFEPVGTVYQSDTKIDLPVDEPELILPTPDDPDQLLDHATAELAERDAIERALDLERAKKRRLVSGMDDEDLNAMIRASQKVSIAASSCGSICLNFASIHLTIFS